MAQVQHRKIRAALKSCGQRQKIERRAAKAQRREEQKKAAKNAHFERRATRYGPALRVARSTR
jgi:hypothetical protein